MDGERIVAARKRKGWSQQDLADALGTSQATIHRYETGNRDPRSGVVVDLSKALGVTVSYLLGVTDEPAPTKLPRLAPDEAHLLSCYRACSARFRDTLIATAESFRDSSEDAGSDFGSYREEEAAS